MIEIDENHIDLIGSLVKCHKPKTILELGYGTGKSASKILESMKYNNNDCKYTIVDNWQDFGGYPPIGSLQNVFSNHDVEIVSAQEIAYVFGTNSTYDFILSDADHNNTDKWFDYVYTRILNKGGILIYHDVSLDSNVWGFKNLNNIYYRCKELNLKFVHFNKNTLESEKCDRGLLVIFKY